MKIGIDIGGSHIAIGLVNEKGEIIKKAEKDINKKVDMHNEIVNYIDESIAKLSKMEKINYIGVVAPGNPKGAVFYNLVNLGLKELDLSCIEEKYNIKIKSINDAKAAGLAEKQYGIMKDFSDGVFICLGTGIGGAVFLNNKLLLSNRNPGFELGHIIIDRNGPDCNCGKRGCFETFCSIKRFKENILTELKKIDNQIKIENSSEIIEILQKYKHNESIGNLINNYIDNLIVGLSNIIDIFEPEIIALGGSFVYFEDIIYSILVQEMEDRKYVFNKKSIPQIKLAKLGNDAGIIGATLI